MRQQGQALPEQLPLAEHRTQVWPPGTEPTQHGDTGPLGTGQAPPTGAELIWLLAWKSSCCCHAPLGQHRQPSLCLCMLGFVPEFQLPVQLHHDCQSRAGATTHQHPVRVSTAGSGKGAVGQNPVLWWEGFPAPHPGSSCGPARAGVLLFSQRWGRQVQLEVLVLEDAAGGRVPLGNTEQPVLVTAAVAPARQLRQESQLQGKPLCHPGTFLQGTESPGHHCVPAAAREALS